jgi:hypothetical protein
MKITVTDPIIRFIQDAQKPRVSIYCPTHRLGPETRQDPIRLKNLLRQTDQQLRTLGMGDQVDTLLRPIWSLMPNLDFWRHQQEGLAILATLDECRHFHLPYTVPEIAIAANDFYLKPLLPLLCRNEQFFILALNKHQVKMYEASRYGIHRVPIPEVPESVTETLKYDEAEQQLQRRSFGPTTGPSGGSMAEQGANIYHGQGGEKDVHRQDLLRFFRAIDRGVQRHLANQKLPMVLAGVEYYFSIYHETNTYPHLIRGGIAVGTDAVSEDELRDRAWIAVKPHLDQNETKVLQRFERIAFQSGDAAKNATREIEPTVVAAYEGRIDSLVLPRNQEIWGQFDPETAEVKRESTDPAKRCELLDFAAMQTVLHGGEVFLISKERMPPDVEVAALLRYSGGLHEKIS